mmetsp:Transcript_114661/g.214704  ORF Transcript_114661/g.214704 Transcript_114661/m.214704 type:complete len:424 (+) Transcript_114661:76-1347(+)
MATHVFLISILGTLLASSMHAKSSEELCDAHPATKANEHILLQVKTGGQSRVLAWPDLAVKAYTNASAHNATAHAAPGFVEKEGAPMWGSRLSEGRSTVLNISHRDPGCRVNGAPADLATYHNLSFQNYMDHHGGLQGLFVYPPSKFAFCLIEKNACSTWIKTVMQPLLRKMDSSEPTPEWKMDYNVSHRSQEMFGVKGIEQIFHDPDATRAVFVREPLERFASAFMNKCLGSDIVNCPVYGRKFGDVVEWALQTDLTDAEINGHWRLQAYHCELHERIQGYNVIGLIEEDTFAHDMNCVLTRAGLDSFVELYHDVPVVNRGALNTASVLKKLFTPDAARRLIQHMHDDYDLFGLPTPAWVEDATGEWFDAEPVAGGSLLQMKVSNESSSNESSSLAGMEKQTDNLVDADNIVDLAYRMGYVS